MAISGVGYSQPNYSDAFTGKKKIEHSQDERNLMEEICKQKEEILEKVRKGETEPSFSIGAGSFTFKQWDKLMKNVDKAIDDMQERVDDEKEEQKKEQVKRVDKKEENAITMEMLSELLG